MKFECSFCSSTININEHEFANWNKGIPVHCDSCKDKYENNINQTLKILA